MASLCLLQSQLQTLSTEHNFDFSRVLEACENHGRNANISLGKLPVRLLTQSNTTEDATDSHISRICFPPGTYFVKGR